MASLLPDHGRETPGAPPIGALLSADFDTAARLVLEFLHERLGFGLWMVTRTAGEDWVVLSAEDHAYGVSDGDLFRWSDSFCSRMVLGLGPRVAPRSDEVPAYVEAPIGREVAIKAYVGVPIESADGSLFGTLCAIDPAPQPEEIAKEQALVELLAGLLGNILARERDADEERRRAERAELDATRDELTGLVNRRGWDIALDVEEARCRRYGDPAAVFMVDLDALKPVNDAAGHAAGDELLSRTARTLLSAARTSDVVARVGGDEFALLAVSCSRRQARALGRRIEASLSEAGIDASVGHAVRDPSRGLGAAMEEADAEMYASKRERRAISVGAYGG